MKLFLYIPPSVAGFSESVKLASGSVMMGTSSDYTYYQSECGVTLYFPRKDYRDERIVELIKFKEEI